MSKWNGVVVAGMVLLGVYDGGAAVGWRGDGTGYFPDADAPLRWSADENVVWKTPLPDFSNAHPVRVGDRLFVCVEPSTLVCINAADGSILWERTKTLDDVQTAEDRAQIAKNQAQAKALREEKVPLEGRLATLRERLTEHAKNRELTEQWNEVQAAYRKDRRNQELRSRLAELDKERRALPELVEVYKEADDLEAKIGALDKKIADLVLVQPRTHKVNGYTSPTPVSDGESIFVLYGTGVAAAYGLDGTEKWARKVEQPTHTWGHSASPLLADGKLILHVLNLIALEPKTGETVWTAPSRPRWGSPVATRVDGADVVITANGEIVRAADGAVLAKGLQTLTYCAPLVHDGIVYFIENGGAAYRLSDVLAGKGKPEPLWRTSPRKDRYYASPVYHDGLLYTLDQKCNYSVIDAQSGEVLASRALDLGGTAYPSITFAGGRLYVSSDTGKTVVLEPGQAYKELAVNPLPGFRTSPLFVGNRVYIRTADAFYCIGK